MNNGLLKILLKRRFWPLFVAQFLGAANDNLFKTAMAVLVIYRLSDLSPVQPQILVNVAAGLFILPFFLFSASAGQLADRFEKSGLIRIVKFAEIVIALLGAWALLSPSVIGMLAVLFLLGTHAAFFGPLKYAIIPEQIEAKELVAGNALIEGGTFLAILLGTIAGSVLVLDDDGARIVASLVVGFAVAGFAASLLLPKARAGNPRLSLSPNFLGETVRVLGMLKSQPVLLRSVVGISWFWLVGATYLAQFPAFAKHVLGADEQAVTLMLCLFSVGIGAGSLLCARLLKGEVTAKFSPFAAIIMSLAAFDLWLACQGLTTGAHAGQVESLGLFLAKAESWRVLADLFLLALAGGVYVVPLYALLQSASQERERARMVAANNIVNAAFMVFSALASAIMLGQGFDIPGIFLSVGAATLGAALYVRGLERFSSKR